MKTTIDLPENLVRHAKAVAALRGWKLRELVMEGILRVLEESGEAGGKVTKDAARAVEPGEEQGE